MKKIVVLCGLYLFLGTVGWSQEKKVSEKKNFTKVSIIVPESSAPAMKIAASELSRYLKKIYPGLEVNSVVGKSSVLKNLVNEGQIYIGKSEDIKAGFNLKPDNLPADSEAYTVMPLEKKGKIYGAYIAGGSDRAVLYGVYGLLEKLGCGFYQSTEFVLPVKEQGVDFSAWKLSDSPLVKERFMFVWPNFLTGCSSWDKKDWSQWVEQSQKQGVNTIMVHAYPNDPVFTFKYNGIDKPVGYWPNSAIGRGWSNTNINDVRRMPAGDAIASEPVFGSEFSMVSDEKRISIAQKAMYDVFEEAHQRDMKVNFAFDFDKPNFFSEEMLTAFASSEKIGKAPNPETAKGYAYYKSQMEGLLSAYPQINTVTLWNISNGVFSNIKEEEFPAAWRTEFETLCNKDSRIKPLGKNGRMMFLISKVAAAYRKALDEIGHKDVQLALGNWYHNNTDWMEAACRILPKEIKIIPLDYSILTNQSMMMDNNKLKEIEKWSAGRIMPVIWNQHDDGGYLGKPSHMVPDFENRLKLLNSTGFGMIHWMVRPYDLFFKWHNRQVWNSSVNEPLEKAAHQMAADWCGKANADVIGKYLVLWSKEAPELGRGTQETFFYHGWKEGVKNAPKLIALCKERLKLLDTADTSVMTAEQKIWLEYFKCFEKFLADFCEAQDNLQKANALIVEKKYDAATEIFKKIDAPAVIEAYAKMVRLMPDDKGQKAMVLRLGYAWGGEVTCLRQMAGLEPVRICFGKTIPEPLSDGGTYYNNFYDKKGMLWRQYGENELPKFTTVKKIGAADNQTGISEEWKEIAQQGILLDKPLDAFAVQAINKGFEYSWNEGELRQGSYTLTLLMSSENSGKDPIKVTIGVSHDVSLVTKPAADDKENKLHVHGEKGENKSIPLKLETIGTKEAVLSSSDNAPLQTVQLKVQVPNNGKIFLSIKPEQGKEIILNGLTLSFDK